VGADEEFREFMRGRWATMVRLAYGLCWADAQWTSTVVAVVRPSVIAGSAAPSAASLKVTLTDGSSVPVRVVAIGNERLWAMTVGSGQRLKSWIAFDASGKQVDSGG
jgi:hypothetical protein